MYSATLPESPMYSIMEYMVRDQSLTDVVRRALEVWPGSDRSLAKLAGVPHVTVSKLRTGRLGASPEVARRLLAVLEPTAQSLADAADFVRRELERAERPSNPEED